MKTRNIFLAAFIMPLIIACSDPTPTPDAPEQLDTTETKVTQETVSETTTSESSAVVLEGTDYLVTITTDYGVMKAILHDQTPQHKENFLKLAREGFYDGLLFHRVIQGFMIQGGDPDSKTAAPEQNLGAGGPGYKVPAEFVPELFHVKGALSAARQGDRVNPERASSGSQFYIVQGKVTPREKLEGVDQNKIGQAFQQLMRTQLESELAQEYLAYRQANPNDRKGFSDLIMATADRLSAATGIKFEMAPERITAYSTLGGTPFLDDQYTVFGQVISGLEVIDKIAAVETGRADRPVNNVTMTVTVEELPKTAIAEQYGNPY